MTRNSYSPIRKKGSISLSINAIVVVVLAFVMLGLGLTLTKTIFSDVGSTAGEINEQVRQQILDDLRTGNKPLSFPSNNVNLKYRDDADIVLGIKNTGDGVRYYCLSWEARDEAGLPIYPAPAGLSDSLNFVYINDPRVLSGAATDVIPVKLRARQANQGLYQGKLIVYESMTPPAPPPAQQICPSTYNPQVWKVHAQKTFFINVN